MFTSEPTVRIQRDDFNVETEMAAIRDQVADAGAIVSFAGLCRGEGNRLAALEIEHYPGMAEAEVTRIVREAMRRWPLLAATVIHRHGRILAGENIVLVIVASGHRKAAFAASEFLMDWLKSSAPFWKREHHADGRVGEWVEARAADDVAARSWDCASDASQPQPHPTGLLIAAADELTSRQNTENRREDHEFGVG